MPPKNMTSWARNTHMPRLAAFFCCASVANWCCSAGLCACSSTTTGLACNGNLPHLRNRVNLLVVISFPGHDRLLVKIERRRRRRRLPLQSRGVPWIRRRRLTVAHGPGEVNHRQQVAHRQNGSARSREHIQNLELWRIRMITPRHPHISQKELRKECAIESYKDNKRAQFAPELRIHAAGNFGPPEMHPAKVSHHHAADH